jgi:hypothetical protein
MKDRYRPKAGIDGSGFYSYTASIWEAILLVEAKAVSLPQNLS